MNKGKMRLKQQKALDNRLVIAGKMCTEPEWTVCMNNDCDNDQPLNIDWRDGRAWCRSCKRFSP